MTISNDLELMGLVIEEVVEALVDEHGLDGCGCTATLANLALALELQASRVFEVEQALGRAIVALHYANDPDRSRP